MRLIQTLDFTQTDFNADQVPRYAILSHRWEQDELTFQDVERGIKSKKRGFQKIKQACRIAKKSGCDWLWIDTCCIDKRNAVELNEAINAMYKWYEQAYICIAYLFDHTDKVNDISDSSWFERCWTLQELIAPADVRFYDSRWTYVGSKSNRCSDIAAVTGIPQRVLKGADLKQYSIAQRMSWAANRKATRVEDEAYSLLGLFNLSMPTLYGNGRQAFQSLQEKLLQKHDQSILLWDRPVVRGSCEYKGLLAESPADFASCGNTRSTESLLGSIMLVGQGVELEVDTVPCSLGVYYCILDSTSSQDSDQRDAILLQKLEAPNQYARILNGSSSISSFPQTALDNTAVCKKRKLYVHHDIERPPMRLFPGIRIGDIRLLPREESFYNEARILSRLDGQINLHDPCPIARLPSYEWGTAGVIYLSPKQRNFNDWPIWSVKIGFDTEGCPIIRLNTPIETPVNLEETIRHPPRPGRNKYQSLWSSHWTHEHLEPRTKIIQVSGTGDNPSTETQREYTSMEYFFERGFEQHTANSAEPFQLHKEYLSLKVSLRLEDCLPVDLPRRLSMARHGSWKIWTLYLRETADFVGEAKVKAEADYMALRSTRKVLYTAAGVTVSSFALGWLYYQRQLDKDEKSRRERKEQIKFLEFLDSALNKRR